MTIDVYYSSLNYKDALSARRFNRVTKTIIHMFQESMRLEKLSLIRLGHIRDDWVIVAGNDLGTNTFGGFGGIIRVPVSG